MRASLLLAVALCSRLAAPSLASHAQVGEEVPSPLSFIHGALYMELQHMAGFEACDNYAVILQVYLRSSRTQQAQLCQVCCSTSTSPSPSTGTCSSSFTSARWLQRTLRFNAKPLSCP
jgi:hypothetical protein